MGVSTLSSFSKAKRCSFQGQPPWEKSSTSPLGSTWKQKEQKPSYQIHDAVGTEKWAGFHK